MTWIVGASSLFGYGVMISDVRVTFANGRQEDLVRKAFPMAPCITAGFAGSVEIGFALLQDLAEALDPPDEVTNSAWDPKWVAEHWSPRARAVFQSARPEERAGHAHILMVGVSPDENLGDAAFPRVYVVRFVDPLFEPEILDAPLSVMQIGNGSEVPEYGEAIRSHFEWGSQLSLDANAAGSGAWAHIVSHTLAATVRDFPIDGISPHVHILLIERGRISESKNDEGIFPEDGSGPIEVKMPAVAQNYAEFIAMCRTFGADAACATA
jgi:hypothetical protein